MMGFCAQIITLQTSNLATKCFDTNKVKLLQEISRIHGPEFSRQLLQEELAKRFERRCMKSTRDAQWSLNIERGASTVEHNAFLAPKPCSVCQNETPDTHSAVEKSQTYGLPVKVKTLPHQKWLPTKLKGYILQQISSNICHQSIK